MSLEKFIPIQSQDDMSPQDLMESSCASSEPYALMVLGDDMEPEFFEGDVIVIEPHGHARHESFVIAQHNGEYTFRQLIIEEERYYLNPLNPAYEREEIQSLRSVKGVITQKKSPGRNNRKSYV